MIAELNKKDVLNYCEHNSHQDSKIVQELIKYTFKNESAPQMISGIQVGNVLQSLIMASNAKQILEIGMFTGYSALKMAEILPEDGMVHTCELGENHIKTAQKFIIKELNIKVNPNPRIYVEKKQIKAARKKLKKRNFVVI